MKMSMDSHARSGMNAAQDDLTHEWIDCFEKYQVNITKPLTQHNTRNCKAYIARCLRGAAKNEDLLAMVMTRPTQLRTDALHALQNQNRPSLLRIYAWGPVPWPMPEHREVCVIMQRPTGPKLASTHKEIAHKIDEKDIVSKFILPMVETLTNCETRKINPGNIHPENLYFSSPNLNEITLGDCFCGPTDYMTPAIYLPVERAMATPEGRGPATMADQLYSLGASILALAVRALPAFKMSESEIVEEKIMRGSYAALVSGMKVPIGLIEPVRGLLIDDVNQRWTLNELNQWITGRRLTPKIPTPPKRAPRELRIGPIGCWNLESAGYAIAKHPKATHEAIQDERLDKWLRRALIMDQFADKVSQDISAVTSLPKMRSSIDTTASRLSILMSPSLPIRYMGLSIMPLGFSTMLAELVVKGKSTEDIIALYYHKSLLLWTEAHEARPPSATAITSLMDELRSFLSNNSMGLGVERIVYTANPGLPCLSDAIKFYNCMSARDVLEAIDMVAVQVDRPIEPFDRHIAAFLGAKAKFFDDSILSLTDSTDPSTRYIAMMRVYGAIQSHEGPHLTPNLASWFGDLITEIIGRYKNRKLRADFEKTALELAQIGELTSIANLLGNAMVLETDLLEFKKATSRFSRLNRSIKRLKDEIASDQDTTMETSRMVAAFISSAVSLVGATYGLFLIYG